MKHSGNIKLNAALLLVIFTLNTLVCFACSVGFTMKFNAEHCSTSKPVHSVRYIHQHKDVAHQQHSHQQEPSSNNHNCCKEQVEKFIKLDKVIPVKDVVDPVFVTAFYFARYQCDLALRTDVVKDIKVFVRNYHPPIGSIRIAIQSFQI